MLEPVIKVSICKRLGKKSSECLTIGAGMPDTGVCFHGMAKGDTL